MKNKHAVSLGRRGGLARAASQTEAERKQLAQRAIRARWDKRKQAEPSEPLDVSPASLHGIHEAIMDSPCSDPSAMLLPREGWKLILERIDYSCGCSATGAAPLPRRCAVHHKAEPVAIMEVK